MTIRRVAAAVALLTFALLAAACAATGGDTTSPGSPVPATVGDVPATGASPPGTTAGTTAPGTTAGLPRPTGTGGTAGSTTSSTSSTTGPAASAVPRGVTVVQLDLVDSSRPTVSRGATRSSSRSLPTTVYIPDGGDGPWPLVVFGHGYRLGPSHYDRIARVVAGAGYVVAAPSFPLADEAVAGAAIDRGDLPNQAGDVSFVLDQLLGPAAGPELAGRIDPSRIGMVGHSDGADVALDVGYVVGRADPRVRAVVALSPDPIPAPGAGTGAGTPLLVVHGDQDPIAPFSGGRTVFGQVSAHRYFVALLGADHLGPVQGAAPWATVLDGTTIAFLDRYVAGRAPDDRGVLNAGTRPGFATIGVAG